MLAVTAAAAAVPATREEEGIEPPAGTCPLPPSSREERRGIESAAGGSGGRERKWENAEARRGGRWPLAGVRRGLPACLAAASPATSILPPFFGLSVSLVLWARRVWSTGPVVCWSCFAGGGWPLPFPSHCSAMLRPHAQKASSRWPAVFHTDPAATT